MGSYSYDRDVYSGSSYDSWGASDYSSSKLNSTSLDSKMLPKGKIIKSDAKTPIVIVLDVTGSNINFARLVYDKFPMFYGELEQKGYLKDFDISICAVGDAYTDDYSIQINDFAKGLEIDSNFLMNDLTFTSTFTGKATLSISPPNKSIANIPTAYISTFGMTFASLPTYFGENVSFTILYLLVSLLASSIQSE